jgi:hypothetical protein
MVAQFFKGYASLKVTPPREVAGPYFFNWFIVCHHSDSVVAAGSCPSPILSDGKEDGHLIFIPILFCLQMDIKNFACHALKLVRSCPAFLYVLDLVGGHPMPVQPTRLKVAIHKASTDQKLLQSPIVGWYGKFLTMNKPYSTDH